MKQPHHHHHHHSNHHCHHYHHHHMLIHPCSISSSHHHHHHIILHHCALHNPITNPQPALPNTPLPASSATFQTQILLDDGANKFDDEEDEELIFVMTDEWRDFFAKSDARRREAKKLAKRQEKSQKQPEIGVTTF